MLNEWKRIFPWGDVRHPNGDFHVDAGFGAAMVKTFKEIVKRYGFQPAIAGDHKIIVQGEQGGALEANGITYGKIRDLDVRPGDGIYALFDYNKVGAQLKHADLFSYISPSYWAEWTDTATGDKFVNMLREVSFVSSPHIKNLNDNNNGAINSIVLNFKEEGEPMAEDETKEESTDMEEEEESTDAEDVESTDAEEGDDLIALTERVVALEEAMLELMDVKTEPSNSSDKPSAASLEIRMLRGKYEARTKLPGADDATIAALAVVSMSDEDAFKTLLLSLSESANVPKKGRSTKPVGNGRPAVKRKASIVLFELAEKAADKGIPRGTELTKFLLARDFNAEDIDGAVIAKAYAGR